MNTDKNYSDYTYRLIELVDEMNKSVENAKSVISQQLKLVEVIEHSEDKDMFNDFIKTLNVSTEDQKTKIADCELRAAQIQELIEMCKESEDAVHACSLILEGLGIMKAEDKFAADSKE